MASAPGVVDVDAIVVGAGAAGVAAALVIAGSGLRAALVDAGTGPAGQYHRGSTEAAWLRQVAALRDHVSAGDVAYLPSTIAYAVERDAESGSLTVLTRGDDLHAGELGRVRGRALVVATGAHDRPLPVPGWELPGAMTPGAAQALVKGSATLPGDRIVVAGTGPFLPAVAATILAAGGGVAAVVEARSATGLARRAAGLRTGAGRVPDALRFAAMLARHRVPYLMGSRVRRIHGVDVVEGVTVARVDDRWQAIPGTDRLIEADAIALGYGFTPNLDLAMQVGCVIDVDDCNDASVRVDGDQRTSVAGVYAAGETTGVGGVHLAAYEGIVAGGACVRDLGADPGVSAASVEHARRRAARLRRFAGELRATFAVQSGWQDDLLPETLVCRCEEVSVGRVRDAIDTLGAPDARTVKLLTRAGMGWCQGRICGPIVESLCPAAAGAPAPRPVIAPVPLGALARTVEP